MIQRLLSGLLALLFVVLTFAVASLLVALTLSAGLLLVAWAWWRGRGRRDRVIEGEYRIIEIR